MTDKLDQLIADAKRQWEAMTDEERAAMLAVQRESWARGEAGLRESAVVARPITTHVVKDETLSEALPEMRKLFKEPEFIAPDGTVRKQHYGAGEQPWDIAKRLGWAPEFAAGNALKYVRRHAAKNGEDDLEKGRWYYQELVKLANDHGYPAIGVLAELRLELTLNELTLLEQQP